MTTAIGRLPRIAPRDCRAWVRRALRRRSRRHRLRTNLPIVAVHGIDPGARVVSERTLSVLDGSTFVVGTGSATSARTKDVCTGFSPRTPGSYRDGSSAWGPPPLELLSLDQSAHFDAQFFLTPTVEPDDQAPYTIVRHRLVDHVWMEEITVMNHLHQTSQLHLALEVDTDFADLFEVKDGAVAEAKRDPRPRQRNPDAGLPTGRVSPLGHDRGQLTGGHNPLRLRLHLGARGR